MFIALGPNSLLGLHADDEKWLAETGFATNTNPATVQLAVELTLATRRAIAETLKERLAEQQKEFEVRIAALEMRLTTMDRRVNEAERSASANRKHAENLERKFGQLIHGHE